MQQYRGHRERSPLLAHSPAKERAPTLRQNIWTVLRFRASARPRSGLQLASYLLELCVLVLILLNVVLAISESAAVVEAPEPARGSTWYGVLLFTSTVIFSVEYALRLWSCVEDERYQSAVVGRLTWMAQPLSVLDFVALLPFYLEICFQFMLIPSYTGALVLRSLRLLRVISFLRLERSYNALKNLRAVLAHKREELLVVSYLTMVLVLTSSTAIFFLENSAQPDAFASIGACAWWSVETITSLGYGDIVPHTSAGRLFGAVLAIWGVVLFTIPGAVLGSGFIEVMLEKQQRDEEDECARSLCELSSPLAASAAAAASNDVDVQPGNLPSPTPSFDRADAPRHLSPRVAVTQKLELLALRLDAAAARMERCQEKLCGHQAALAAVAARLQQQLEVGAPVPPADAN